MSQFGARVPITTAIGYQVAAPAVAGWKRLAELVTIPPDTTGALIYAFGAALPWMQAVDAIPANPNGQSLAAGNYLTLDDSTQIAQLCLDTGGGISFGIQFFSGPVGKLPAITAPGNGGGGGGGVQTVTGWQVDNTDPANPVITDPGPPVMPAITTAKALWVNQGASANLPPTAHDMSRSFPSINAALAVYNYAAGDVIVLLPGVHLINPGTNMPNVRIHFMDAQLMSVGIWNVTGSALVELSGSGSVSNIRDVFGTIRSNGIDILSNLNVYGGSIYLNGDYGSADLPASMIVTGPNCTIEIQGDHHGWLIIAAGTYTIRGTFYIYDGGAIQLDTESYGYFYGSIIDRSSSVTNGELIYAIGHLYLLVHDMFTALAKTCIANSNINYDNTVEVRGTLFSKEICIQNLAGPVRSTTMLRANATLITGDSYVIGGTANPASVLNIQGAWSNAPVSFTGIINGSMNTFPWVS